MKLKNRIWEILENTKPDDKTGRIDDIFIMTLIILNVIAVVLGSVKRIQAEYKTLLDIFELFSVIVFTIEYVLRVWACVVDVRYSKPILGRIRFSVTPMAIIDFFAILPFYLPYTGLDLRVIRVFRLFRLFRIAKAARYVSSLKLLGRVFKSKKEELVVTTIVMLILLIVASALMYFFENSEQPDKFPDIPSTFWWAIATLTTVGYGDVFPITAEGKMIASLVAVLGIGLFALPTGILGAGFVEEFQKSKKKSTKNICPHCGKGIDV
ncbi:potassium channel protein [candidate division KSB1 bacterium RBG_16_48_16]|nr:MAG: potassium channel protein [candidate division KSB1 bacterium RBG_16_48_16]